MGASGASRLREQAWASGAVAGAWLRCECGGGVSGASIGGGAETLARASTGGHGKFICVGRACGCGVSALPYGGLWRWALYRGIALFLYNLKRNGLKLFA